jgi:cell division protein FtsA
MSNHVVAIDLGTTKVVSIVGEKTENGRYRILAYSEVASSGIVHGQVENVEKVICAVRPTLDRIKAKTGITEINDVFVGIAGEHITCVENRTEIVRDKYDELITIKEIKELESAASKLHLNKGETILHVIPKNYTIDETDDILDPVGRLGHKITGHFHVIIGIEKNSRPIDVCMANLDLSLQKLILEPIASARTVLSDDEKEMGVAMLDMGGGTTDLIVYEDGIIKHTAVIPFGGNSITNDIKNGCSLLFCQAEKAKIKFGLLLKDNEDLLEVEGINGRSSQYIRLNAISNIIESRLEEIMKMVMTEIEKANCRKLNAGLVITGGVSKMKNIKAYLEEKTGMIVKIANPDYLSDDSPREIIHPKYSTAVGLVMCGFDHLEIIPSPPPPLPPPLPPPPPPPPPLPWWQRKQWTRFKKVVIDFMNPQQEEKND